ncbi:bone morphogenetic protein 1-like [Amphiura filiformis]|uniref:bone morphogenetic protein 1-like n=1 Tax=Amphiura filiformis TaxID=82378 RepID=UPI003B22015D
METDHPFILFRFRSFELDDKEDYFAVGIGDIVRLDRHVLRLNGNKAPNTFIVNSSAIWMYFNSDDRYQYNGFRIGITRLSQFGVCGEEIISLDLEEDLFHRLRSPYYPNKYPTSLFCVWLFSSPAQGFITFRFYHFKVETNYDFLHIGRGHNISIWYEIYKLHGHADNAKPNSITINGTEAWVTFETDSILSYSGFDISVEWTRYYVPCRSSEFRCHSGYGCLSRSLVCDVHPTCNDKSDELKSVCYNEVCGQQFHTVSSTEASSISSPGYPAQYSNNIHCQWTFVTRNGQKILLEIIDFELERGFDTLMIGGYGSTGVTYYHIVTLTGTVRLHTIPSLNTSMQLEFSTDRTGIGKGFRVNIRQFIGTEVACTADEIDCGGGFCADITARCNGFNDCLNYVDEENCTSINCPVGTYRCEETNQAKYQMCLYLDKVCDGELNCPLGDDEKQCGKYWKIWWADWSNQLLVL